MGIKDDVIADFVHSKKAGFVQFSQEKNVLIIKYSDDEEIYALYLNLEHKDFETNLKLFLSGNKTFCLIKTENKITYKNFKKT